MHDRSSPGDWIRRAVRPLITPVFVVCAVILSAAAVGLRPGMAALAEHYRKQSIALRRPLQDFDPSRLPSFRASLAEPPVDSSFEEAGTDDYLVIGLEELGARGPDRAAFLFVTYYSDPDDKVPHTPEVCYRQTGVVVESMTTITIDTPDLAPDHPRINARLLILRRTRSQLALIYVFCVNGEFRCERTQVRWMAAWPGDRYVYFSKVEAITYYELGADPTPAIERSKKLLREALTVLVTDHYPDNEAFKRR